MGCLPAWAVQIYQAWLLFLYTSFALRENALIANGSHIRPWWICHHYLAMVMVLISVTCEINGQPDCSIKQRGVKLFLRWAIMQGIAVHLQNRYQRQRLRSQIALGKTWQHVCSWFVQLVGKARDLEGRKFDRKSNYLQGQVGVQSNLFCGVHCSQTVSNGKLVSIATHSDKVKTKALESNKTLI